MLKISTRFCLQQRNWLHDENTKSIHLFIPGVDKKSLKIKQTEENIYILHRGSHRSIDISENWRNTYCNATVLQLNLIG